MQTFGSAEAFFPPPGYFGSVFYTTPVAIWRPKRAPKLEGDGQTDTATYRVAYGRLNMNAH